MSACVCLSLLHTTETVHTCTLDRMSGMQVPLSDTVWSKFSRLWSLLTEKQERGLIQRRGITLPSYCLLLYSPVFKCLLILTYTIFKLVAHHLWVSYLLCRLFSCVLSWSYHNLGCIYLSMYVLWSGCLCWETDRDQSPSPWSAYDWLHLYSIKIIED